MSGSSGTTQSEPHQCVVGTRYGRLTVPDSENDLIGQFLSRYGEWGWLEVVFVASVIPDGARVLDVGAFVGTFGLGVAGARRLGFLCCVEANAAVSPCLRSNIDNNAPCPSLVLETLVAGPEATAQAGHSLPGNLGSMSYLAGPDAAFPRVRGVTLAELRAEHGAFNLIKLDIEGMELEALQGDAEFLARGGTTLWIEANEDIRSLEVADMLLSLNLELFYFAFPAFNPHNFNGDEEPVFPFAFEAGLLAAPATPPSLSQELTDAGCILRPVRTIDELKDALWRTPRWGMSEWQGAASIEEMAALVGRTILGEAVGDFLSQGTDLALGTKTTIWQKLETALVDLQSTRAKLNATEEAVQQAQILAADRLNQLEAEQRRRGQAEDHLCAATALAAERLNQLAAEQRRRGQAEDHLCAATTLAAERLNQLAAEQHRLGQAAGHLHVATLRREQVEEALREITALASERLDQLQSLMGELHSIQSSSVWRFSSPVRRFVGRRPILRAILRRARALAGGIVRRLRRRGMALPTPDSIVPVSTHNDSDAADRAAVGHYFDPAWYLTINQDVLTEGIDPLDHFLQHGWREGRSPGPGFDVAHYLETYDDVAAAGINPLLHYVRAGESEGRLPRRQMEISPDLTIPVTTLPGSDAADREAVHHYFDATWYLAINQDVLAEGVDPLDHFLQHGWREGRSPGPGFDVPYYLETNDDVAAASINPLLHYVRAGKSEGRLPRRQMDMMQSVLNDATSPRERVNEWTGFVDRSAPLPPHALATALGVGRIAVPTIVSVSHDDYAANFGGIQNVIVDEQLAFEAAGWRYLHLSPSVPLPMLADHQPWADYHLRLRLDGKLIGVVTFLDLAAVLQSARADGTELAFVFHHLLGHVPELLATLPSATDARPIVWIHDFFTLCPSFTLMRNDVKFCSAPPAASGACAVCAYGNDRQGHVPRMQAFFATIHPTVLAPSTMTLDFWRQRSNQPHAGAVVVPPARLIMRKQDDPVTAANEGCLRVAHLGGTSIHKGWAVFQQLAATHIGDPRYEFYHLGLGGVPSSRYLHDAVRVTADHRDAMVEAIIRHQIDIVICWPLWPETFCFTVHEALAGGAFVVTRLAGGNVWPAVAANAPSQGCALADEVSLFHLFESGEIRTRVAGAHRVRGTLYPGGNTAEFLLNDQTANTSLRYVSALHQ